MIKPGSKVILTVGDMVYRSVFGIPEYEIVQVKNAQGHVYIDGDILSRFEEAPEDETLKRWLSWIEYVCRSKKVAVDGYDVGTLVEWLTHMQSRGNQ